MTTSKAKVDQSELWGSDNAIATHSERRHFEVAWGSQSF
jgi:hypothetical protein